MTSKRILVLSSSYSAISKTEAIADIAKMALIESGHDVVSIRMKDLDIHELLSYPAKDPQVLRVNGGLDEADGVVFATPIYKASYSGLLKLFLDQLPQFALAGKAVLPLATGGSLAHVLALDYGLRPVLQSMAARHIIQSHFVLERDIVMGADGAGLEPSAEAPLLEAIHHFECSLRTASGDRWLGHPRPDRSQPPLVRSPS